MKKLSYIIFFILISTFISAQQCIWTIDKNTSGSLNFIKKTDTGFFLEQFYIRSLTDTYTYKRKKINKHFTFSCEDETITYKKKVFSKKNTLKNDSEFSIYLDSNFTKLSSAEQYQVCYNTYQVKLDKPIIVPLFNKLRPYKNQLNQSISSFQDQLK